MSRLKESSMRTTMLHDDDLYQIDLSELEIQSGVSSQQQQQQQQQGTDQTDNGPAHHKRPKSSLSKSRPLRRATKSGAGRQAWGHPNGDQQRPSSQSSQSKEAAGLLDRRRSSAKPRRPSKSARKRSTQQSNGRWSDSDSSDSEAEMIALRRAQTSRLSQTVEQTSLKDLQPREYRTNLCSERWKEFETYIRCIDIDTMHFQPKPTAKAGSTDFKSVMDGIQSEIRQRQLRKKGLKNTMFMAGKMSIFKQRALVELAKDEAEAEAVAEAVEVEKKELARRKSVASTVSAGRRGWNIIKHHLQEKRLERKKNQEMGGWNLLAKTMRQLTDTEKTRQDLYERYLKKSNFWAEGLVNYPQFLVDRETKIRRRGPSRRSGVSWGRPERSMSAVTMKSTASMPKVSRNKLRDNDANIDVNNNPSRRPPKQRPHSSYI